MNKYELLYTGYFAKVNISYVPESKHWMFVSNENGIETYTSKTSNEHGYFGEMKLFTKEAALKYINDEYRNSVNYAQNLRIEQLKTINEN